MRKKFLWLLMAIVIIFGAAVPLLAAQTTLNRKHALDEIHCIAVEHQLIDRVYLETLSNQELLRLYEPYMSIILRTNEQYGTKIVIPCPYDYYGRLDILKALSSVTLDEFNEMAQRSIEIHRAFAIEYHRQYLECHHPEFIEYLDQLFNDGYSQEAMELLELFETNAATPGQYQEEWQEEHYRYLVERSDLSEEFQDFLARADEIDNYILTVIDQMIYEGYEPYCIAERISSILEKYKLPLLREMTNGAVQPFSTGINYETTRTWMNTDPNFSVPLSITHTVVQNGRIYSGTMPLALRRTYGLSGGQWFHSATYRGWIPHVGFTG